LPSLNFEKYDPSGMHKIYDKWPSYAKSSYDSAEPLKLSNADHIVFSGMGGSGAIGDIFTAILSKTSVHVTVTKGYVLPKTVNSKSLVICTSVSGNTVETLSTLKQAHELGCSSISFSSGGMMEKYCTNNNLLYKKIPMTHSPRASFASYLYSILRTIENIIPISKSDIEESIAELNLLSEKINSKNSESNDSMKLSEWIDGIPLIFYPFGLQAAAIRFKNSLQENSKSHAIVEDVIEACHNNIVSWEQPSNVKPILLRGPDDYEKTKERWEILKEYFTKNSIDYYELYANKGGILSKLVCMIYLLDFSSIYLAVRNKIDPSPVKSIDFIKQKLG